MRAEGSPRSLLVWVLPVAFLLLVTAVVVLPQITPGPTRAPSPVTHTRPLDQRRHRDIGYTNEYLYDSVYETCEALGGALLAHKLGVPAATSLPRIAKAFADRNYPTATRSGPYHGCLDALIDQRREARKGS